MMKKNTIYFATFHTHLSAMITARKLKEQAIEARLMPVPRSLSSSCGTCVRYESNDPQISELDTDVESVYIEDNMKYELLWENEITT